MKYTLLDLTQNILSSLNSDEINSYADTVESRQVAEIIKTVYFNIITRTNLPEHKKLFTLTASGDPNKPTLMTIPNGIARVDWIKYNKGGDQDTQPNVDYPHFQYVNIVSIEQFLDWINSFSNTDVEVGEFDLYGFKLYFRDDKHPTYCTIIEDNNVVFDSYQSAVDNTLQSSKTLCYGKEVPQFTMSDTFIPDLDELQFPLLLNEAKSLAFLELKQVPHEKAEQESRRQWNSIQKNKHTLVTETDFDRLPNFSRIGRYVRSPRLH